MTPTDLGAAARRRGPTLAALAIALLISCSACDAEEPGAGPDDASPSPQVTASAETPAFRFAVSARTIDKAFRAPLGRRDRRAVRRTLSVVRDLVTDLYVEGFLDPAGWRGGDYGEVFEVFGGGARAEARERARALTAGGGAGERFTTIDEARGRLWLRALVDRSGRASLVSGVARFRARAQGDEAVELLSDGTYLFRRTEGGWRIVAFDVERHDRDVADG